MHRIKDFVDRLRKEPSHLGVDVSGAEQKLLHAHLLLPSAPSTVENKSIFKLLSFMTQSCYLQFITRTEKGYQCVSALPYHSQSQADAMTSPESFCA